MLMRGSSKRGSRASLAVRQRRPQAEPGARERCAGAVVHRFDPALEQLHGGEFGVVGESLDPAGREPLAAAGGVDTNAIDTVTIGSVTVGEHRLRPLRAAEK